MADYILWGKNPNTGKNVKQEKIIELEARRKTWAVKELESLDALLEHPSFPENQLSSLTSQPYKATKITFSREAARKEAPPETLKILESLWYEIDKLDLIINFYDLAHGKRKKPPRDVLLKKFSPAEIESIKTSAAHLNQYKYLKMRHLLVELRREQFTVRDSYTSLI